MNQRSFALVAFLLICTRCLFSYAPQQSLRDLILKGNLKAVQQLLKENPEYADVTIGVVVKGRKAYEISALCFALRNNQPKIAELLLAAGADPTVNTDGRNLLCYAAMGGYADLIPLLIKKGVDPNAEDTKTFGQPRLPLSQVKDIKTAQALLDNGADVNARTSNGQTPLHHLVTYGSSDVIFFLIKHRADVNAKDNQGCTPLHKASLECLPNKVRFLIDSRADINAHDDKGRNALKRTIEKRHGNISGLERPSFYNTLKILIEEGCDADAGDLVFAGDLSRLKQRLEKKPELIHTYQFRREPLLIIAIYEGHANIVEYLIEKGADIHVRGRFKDPALHLAAFAGNPETVNLLLKAGLNVNQRGVHGELPLHWVSKLPDSGPYQRSCNYEKVARILINAGSELNTPASEAWISIGYGVDTEKPIDQVSFYLRNLEATRINQNVQTIMPPQLAFDVGDTPLHSAARWGRTKIVHLLIEAGAQVDAKNALHQTPLHYAIVYQHPEVVQALLTTGADPTIKTNKEMNAFDFARTINDPAILSLLKETKL